MSIITKIIKGEIPCIKVMETELTLAFMDINPIAPKHVLVIPKYEAQFLHQVPDESMADLAIVLKRVCAAVGAEQYNVLQNNGPMAHQEVPHVHFHVIPKPDAEQGLIVGRWQSKQVSKDQLQQWADEIKTKL
jgi:diadenosine tetraphosphate (Ap4A) HIT family hydrolase